MVKVSVVINTLNEEKNIEQAIKSASWADEILVCDMHSEDSTVKLAKSLGAKVIFHDPTGYVEPARNFAISKALGEWILILDADEEIPPGLSQRLQAIAEGSEFADFVEIPRKNMIFGKWIKASMWWPDYNIRFFKKGKVTWGSEIHRKPQAVGQALTLSAEERLALTHYHYKSVSQFVIRLDRYTDIQAEELVKSGYEFKWQDLILKPSSEFLSRFFAERGFEDGLHGLALSLLQAFSFIVMYLKVWEKQGFKEAPIRLPELEELSQGTGKELKYWLRFSQLSKNPLTRMVQKIKNKLD